MIFSIHTNTNNTHVYKKLKDIYLYIRSILLNKFFSILLGVIDATCWVKLGQVVVVYVIVAANIHIIQALI